MQTTKEDVAIKMELSSSSDLFVEMEIFQVLLKKDSFNKYMREEDVAYLGLPHTVSFGIFHHNNEELRFVAMPLYGHSLQRYIDAQPDKVIGMEEIMDIVLVVVDVFDYLHSKVSFSNKFRF